MVRLHTAADEEKECGVTRLMLLRSLRARVWENHFMKHRILHGGQCYGLWGVVHLLLY